MAKKPVIDYGWEKLPKYLFILIIIILFGGLFIINYDAVITEKGKYTLEAFIKGHDNTMIVCDESTKIKNFKAKRTIELCKLAAKCACRRILTGSPITKNPLDIFSQAKFLSPDYFGNNYYSFRNRYAILEDVTTFGGASFKKVAGFKNLNELSDKLETFTHRIMKEECLDLPDKTYNINGSIFSIIIIP